jgi:putative hydrolase of the HAD superfamily
MIDISRLDTLILDLGGVIIDVDYERTARAFRELGVERFEEQFSKAKQTDLFDRFERGELSPAAFRDEVRRSLGPELKDRQIDACWNAMLGSIPAERMQLIEELRMRYRVFLLSNTNAIHVPAFMAIVAAESKIKDFRQEFDGCFFSNEMGLRKPEAAIFHRVLKETFATPERTLFIDDSIQHVEGARKAGLTAEHLDLSKEDVLKMVERLGLLA